jgi:hypothetical protein
LEAAEEPLASESPEESALEEAIWTAGSGGTNFQERLLEEACETLDLFSRDLTVDEPTEPAVDQPQHGSSQLDDEQAEPMEIRTDQQDASPAQRDSSEQSTQRGTGKRRGQTRTGERKTTLQSYLPFS